MRRNLFVASVVAGLVAVGVAATLALRPHPVGTPAASGPRLVWAFEAPQPGFVVGAPVVTPEAIYLAAGHPRGFHYRGAVYALDPADGKAIWVYDRDGEMLHTASTPLVAEGRLYVGEGLHNNFACRLHCLDVRTGKADWSFPTSDHIEGGPTLADGLVIFPAGNDGLYALDAATGKEKWNFRADLHIDSTPFVVGGRVYVGSGPSRRFESLQVVCLEVGTGKPVWRTPVKLPAWGSPVVAGDGVFVGLGNGRLTEAHTSPAGGLACFDAKSGAELWTFPVPDAVFGRPAVVGERVVFGCRDGNLYGLTFDGKEAFRVALGGPVMAPSAVDDDRVYAVAVSGRIVCVDAADGREVWRYELKERGGEPKCYSGPSIAGRRLFVAGELLAGQSGVVCLHCFELPETDRP
jgi:outer membrane protein assembly factor BamB